MPVALRTRVRRHPLAWTLTVATALACGTPAAVRAQSNALNVDAPSARPPPPGELDMDVNPALSTGQAKPAPRTDILEGTAAAPADADQSPLVPPGGGTPIIAANDVLAPPAPVSLVHPGVVTTAELQSGETSVTLFGIEGFGGDAAQGLQSFIGAAGDSVICHAHGAAGFVCLLADGTDIARVALVNGAARTRPEAPDSYREQEAAAQAARRGIWVDLPQPPETVQHPVVRNTAILAAGQKVYALDGIVGFSTPYAGQLQGYITEAGDSMTCSPQGEPGHFVCLLPDNTDIAKVALANGAARVAPDAPDAYRAQQLEALNDRRGYWATVSDSVRAATLVPEPQPGYALDAGDDGGDGISYVGGAPTALIDGASVFLVFGAGLGWGYWDHYHHWHGAPDRYRYHMERFHPDGRGLRGFDRAVEYRHPGFQAGSPGPVEHAGVYGQSGIGGTTGHAGAGAPVVHIPVGAMGAHSGAGFEHPATAASSGGFHSVTRGNTTRAAAAAPHASAPAPRHK